MPQLLDRQQIRARLENDRVWSAFALADLEPPYSAFASWFGPTDSTALALVYRAFSVPLLLCVGDARDWNPVLDEVDEAVGGGLTVHVVVRPGLLPVIRHRYSVREARPMVRMVLEPGGRPPVAAAGQVVRIGPADLESVEALYREDTPDFFLPAMLTDGVYFGIRDGEELVAVAGTHVRGVVLRVGALGNVYTRPDHRRRGHASVLTWAVTSELRRSGITTIVLNIRADNHAARRVYERLGYRRYCDYFDVTASRG